MTAPAPPRADLAELLALVDVSRSRAAMAEQRYLADVVALYGERELAIRTESQEESDSLLTEALLLAIVALIRRGYRAGWEEGLRFAEQQFEALRISAADLTVPLDSGDDALVRDFLAGQSFVARSGGPLSELLRRAQLAVASAVQMGRARATEAAFAALTLSDTLHKMWVARFDLSSPPCAECVRLHGTYVPLGSEFEVPAGSPAPYGGVLHAPPRHPNCRCSLILYAPEWFDGDSESGPTPLSMRAYAEWVLNSSARDRADMIAATVVRVGSYTRMVRGKLQHVDGYFYHVESGKVVSPAQARALGAGEIRTVSVQQAKAMRTQGKAPVGKAAGQATARRNSRAPGPGQAALDVGAPAKKPVTAQQAPRPQPAAADQGTARRRVARDPQKQWPKGEYEIQMPSGQNTKVTIHANGSSTATSGDRTEKANARQTKLFLDFWDGQGAVTQTKGDPTPDEKEESEKLGRDLDDPRPDPVRDADRETEWQGDKPPEKAKPPEPEDDVAAKTEGVVQKGRASLDPEKKPEKKADKKPAEKPAAKEPEKKDDAPGDSNSDIKEMSSQELAAEIAEVEDELRDMRRSGMSVEDDDYKDVRQRLQALNAEEDSRTRPDDADQSEAGPAAAEPVAKQAPQPVEKAKPAAKKPVEKKPVEVASKADEVATKEPEAPEPPAEKPPAKKPPAAKKPAAPKPEPVKVSDEDAARKPAAVPKVDKLDASTGRKMLQRAKASEKIVQVAGDDGSAIASAMQLVTSTRHKHHVKVTDDSVRVSLKHIPVADDGSRQYLVHSNGVVFERGIGPDGEETLTQMPFQQVENLVEPKFSGESRPSLDDALRNVRKLTDDQLSDYMDEAIKADRIDDFERIASESDRREGQRARTAAQHEARAAAIERLLDEGFSVGEATEKVTGASVDKQQRKMMINHLRAEGYTGVNLEELSRKAYKNYLYDLELAAEGPTIGYYLNKEGTTRGVDPSSMFYGSDEHRTRYMSDELRDFFEANEFPHSFESWQESYLQQAVDTDQLSRSGDGNAATKTDRASRVDDLPPEPTPAKPSQGRDEPTPAPEPVRPDVPADSEKPKKDGLGYDREPYQDKPHAVDVKPGSDAQLREAVFLFEDGLTGTQSEDDVLGAYLSPDRKTLQVHDKKKALATIDDMVEGVESNVGPDSHMSAEDQKLERGKAKALKQLRARVEKAQVGAKQVAAGKETKRAYADAVSENVDAKRREREAATRAAETPGQRDTRELAAFDTALKDMKPGEPATAQVQAMRDEVAARVEARATPGLQAEVPPAPDLETPPEIGDDHRDLLEMKDQALSVEWKSVQQELKDMRFDGVKIDNAHYKESKARLAAIFAVMARRAQEGNREYIGGTPSRLEKLQELAKAIASEPDASKRSSMEAELLRVFRGEAE